MTVLRCGDRETAERINEMLVAISREKLTSADRFGLRVDGIVPASEGESEPGPAKVKNEEAEERLVVTSALRRYLGKNR